MCSILLTGAHLALSPAFCLAKPEISSAVSDGKLPEPQNSKTLTVRFAIVLRLPWRTSATQCFLGKVFLERLSVVRLSLETCVAACRSAQMATSCRFWPLRM